MVCSIGLLWYAKDTEVNVGLDAEGYNGSRKLNEGRYSFRSGRREYSIAIYRIGTRQSVADDKWIVIAVSAIIACIIIIVVDELISSSNSSSSTSFSSCTESKLSSAP